MKVLWSYPSHKQVTQKKRSKIIRSVKLLLPCLYLSLEAACSNTSVQTFVCHHRNFLRTNRMVKVRVGYLIYRYSENNPYLSRTCFLRTPTSEPSRLAPMAIYRC